MSAMKKSGSLHPQFKNPLSAGSEKKNAQKLIAFAQSNSQDVLVQLKSQLTML